MTAGYQAPRYPEVRDDVVAKWRRTWGDNANVAPDQIDGLWIDVYSVSTAVVYEALSELVAQHYYSTAEGNNLDALLSLFGFERRDASNSTVELLVYGADGTTVTEDSTVSTTDVGDVFVVDADASIASGSLWAVFLFGQADAFTEITITINGVDTMGTFAFGGDPVTLRDGMAALLEPTAEVVQVIAEGEQPDGLAILAVQMQAGYAFSIVSSSGSDVEAHLGELANATAEETGKISAQLGTLTTINTPIPGWVGLVNRSDAVLGAPRQTDTEARAFHTRTLNNAARATPRGLVDELYKLGANRVRYFENLESAPDLLGRPPKSFEIVVDGLDADLIARTIWLNHTTGTQSWGTELHIVQDTSGQVPVDREIRFTRPTSVYVHMRITVVRGEGFPNLEIFDLQTATKQAIVDWGNAEIDMGDDVYLPDIITQAGAVLTGSKSMLVELGSTAGPGDPTPPLSSTNLIIGDRSWAKFSDIRIEVVIA